MSLFHLFLVAVIQGVTEFLPVSSSGHLILLPALTGMQDQGQTIDVAVHVGTLVAVVLYFWRDVKLALGGIPRLLVGKIDTQGARLAFLLLIATIPVIVIGAVLHATELDLMMRGVALVGWTMIIFGVVLYITDQRGASVKTDADWSVKDAIILGLWQALALVPGTSRSGATISGARMLGYTREDGAKLAMLMSIPTIIASGTLLGAEVAGHANLALARDGAIAAAFSCIAALLALVLMMRLLKTVSFTPYVIYRLALGTILLVYAYA
ncbi:undecaprenyl-diphosphate phosphatase [Nereida sp. MMG025]|uniref:undecaprenyl-diphosphate phosphatase n=1 Tax=Nereida sp. MMG025 TaxID=2909981 RepID=UPI001F00200E|nr:undecaprenyl-diphosphate phosphatase [Nereida sp. MMG025]MCF6444540.1 undecaprenyl-diphosphate phosphatase [Nereida sp. MMG025]